MPALVLDDGTVIAESIAICRYFEALHPEPPLFGAGAKDIAMVEMWNRRCELQSVLSPVAAVFRHLHPAMKELEVPQVPAWAEANKPRIAGFLARARRASWRRTNSSPASAITVADITALCAVDFMKPARVAVPDGADEREALARRGVGASEREGVGSVFTDLL